MGLKRPRDLPEARSEAGCDPRGLTSVLSILPEARSEAGVIHVV